MFMSVLPISLFYLDLLRSYVSLLLPWSVTPCCIILLFLLSFLPIYTSEELPPQDIVMTIYGFLRVTLCLVTLHAPGQDEFSLHVLLMQEGSQDHPAFRGCADQALDDFGIRPSDKSSYFGTFYEHCDNAQKQIHPDRVKG